MYNEFDFDDLVIDPTAHDDYGLFEEKQYDDDYYAGEDPEIAAALLSEALRPKCNINDTSRYGKHFMADLDQLKTEGLAAKAELIQKQAEADLENL